MFEESTSSYKDYAEKILKEMEKSRLGVHNISTLLVGDVGTGKTSFVKFFSKLVGLPLVLIEVPHISEEHLINIPFLTINNEGVKNHNEVFKSDFKLVRAKSVLGKTLSVLRPLKQQEYVKMIEENTLLQM